MSEQPGYWSGDPAERHFRAAGSPAGSLDEDESDLARVRVVLMLRTS